MITEIEQVFNESDWTLPPNARLQTSKTEIHSYESVIDHYETRTRQVSEQVITGYNEVVTGVRDLGNGYFEETTSSVPIYNTVYSTETYQEPVYRQEPVYKTNYYYEIDRYVHSRSIETSGKDSKAYWGEYKLLDKERVGSDKGTYYIIGRDSKNKEVTYSMSYGDWVTVGKGSNINLKVHLGNNVEIIRVGASEAEGNLTIR